MSLLDGAVVFAPSERSAWPGLIKGGNKSPPLPVLSLFFVCLFFNFLATPHGMWDLSSPTRDRTHDPCIGSRVLTTGPVGKSLPSLSLDHGKAGWFTPALRCPSNQTRTFWFLPVL